MKTQSHGSKAVSTSKRGLPSKLPSVPAGTLLVFAFSRVLLFFFPNKNSNKLTKSRLKSSSKHQVKEKKKLVKGIEKRKKKPTSESEADVCWEMTGNDNYI